MFPKASIHGLAVSNKTAPDEGLRTRTFTSVRAIIALREESHFKHHIVAFVCSSSVLALRRLRTFDMKSVFRADPCTVVINSAVLLNDGKLGVGRK